MSISSRPSLNASPTRCSTHPRLVAVRVRVEKLDVIDGSVGIEISRVRASQAGKLHQLFAGDLSAKSGG